MRQPFLSLSLIFCLMFISFSSPAHATATPKPTNPLPKGTVSRLACAEPEYFSWVAFSDDGKLAATSHPKNLRLWEVATGKQLWRTPCAQGGALIFSRDGKVLVNAIWEHGITTWDVTTGKQLRRIAPPATGMNRFVAYSCLSFSPDGKVLSALRHSSTIIQLWDWPGGKELRRLPVGPDDHSFRGTVFSSDDRFLAGVGYRHLWLWDVASGRLLRTHKLDEFINGPNDLWFSSDGRLLYYAFLKRHPPGMKFGPPARRGIPPDPLFPPAPPRKDVIEVCEQASGQVVLHVEGACLHDSPLPTPDGRLLGLLTKQQFPQMDFELSFWDARTGQFVTRLKTRGRPLRFSPDGKLLATTTRREILLWDMSRIRAPEPKATAPLTAAALSRLWDDLASADAAAARRAVWSLVAVPDQAVPLLRDRLKPAAADAKRLATLIADLNSDDFPVRVQAGKELEDLGRAAEAALRQVVATGRSLEARRGAERILKRLGPPLRSRRELRAIRAQEVLEYVGTPEATKVLKRMAIGAPAATQTEDAKAALDRLTRRAAKPR